MNDKLATQLRYGGTLAFCGLAGICLFAAMVTLSTTLFGAEWTSEGRSFAAVAGVFIGGAFGLGFGVFVLDELS